MDFESLKREVVRRSGTYVMMRPGITLRLSYPTSIQKLGPAIADILEAYQQFIKPAALTTYLSANGAWKTMAPRILSRDLTEFRSIPARYEFVEKHYGEGEPSHVGEYGAHFIGTDLGAERPPLEENLLLLEFPYDFVTLRSPAAFVAFVAKVAALHPFGSGVAGYSFRHLHLTYRNEAFEAIGELAPRYTGFDIDSDTARRYSRGHVYNVSWLTLLGAELVSELGGNDKLRSELPASVQLHPVKTGLIIQAAELPIVGDVNQGEGDTVPLRAVARLTRRLRVQAENLGPPGDFAARWLTRFDG